MTPRFSSKFAWFWLALGSALSALSAAEARAAAPATSAELVEQGLTLRRARDDSSALELFRRAYRAEPSAMVLAQIALAEQALADFVAAERHLTESLASNDPWITGHRAALETALGVIQARLGWLEVRTSDGAFELRVDGTEVPLASSPLRLIAGKHELVLRRSTGEQVVHAFELEPKSRHVYQLELIEGRLPSARVSPRSQPRQKADPASGGSVAAPRSASRTWAYVTATLAGVALADAVASSLLRQGYVNSYNGPSCEPDRSQRCASYRTSANTFGTIALVSYAVAGAAGVTSLALFTEPWWHDTNGAAAQSAMLSVSGAF